MSHRSNTRNGLRPLRIEWRTVAVSATDTVEYAAQLQSSLQELSDAGFNILSQQQRGTALIILAQRVVVDQSHQPGPISGPEPPLPPPPPLSKLRMQANLNAHADQFVYHFISPDGPQARRFTTMVDALRMVREHVDGDGRFVPGCLLTMTVSTYEGHALGGLLKAYASDIAAQPPKQVD
jgi:hypothetical protein